jgi:sterol desaturase/sphingolipid hydroxylase (fatty acid hydroxylase superfamily)
VGFYFAHRLLHWPPLYELAHKLHHRNTNPGPWSGLSMHPIEHVIYFSTIALFFLGVDAVSVDFDVHLCVYRVLRIKFNGTAKLLELSAHF